MDQHMRSLIARLNLLSNVSAVNPNPGGGKATDEHPGGRQPTGGGRPGSEWWAAYCNSPRPDRVVQEAEDELEHAHRSGGNRDITETAEQLTARIRRLRREGWTIREVSMHCRCTETRVKQADKDTTVAKVLELHGKCTVRQIETITGVPKSTVQRIINAEAA
jgi:DNA-binding transcriptional MerR regulator